MSREKKNKEKKTPKIKIDNPLKDDGFEIIDHKTEDRRKSGILIAIVAALIGLALIIGLYFGIDYIKDRVREDSLPSTTDPIGEPVAQNKQYEFDKFVFEQAGLDLPEDAWEEEQENFEKSEDDTGYVQSPVYQSLKDRVNKELEEFEELTTVDTNYDDLISDIEAQIKQKRFIIENHFGYSENDPDYADSRYDPFRDYVDSIVLSFSGQGDLNDNNTMYDETVDELQAIIRNCLWTEKIYKAGYSAIQDKLYGIYDHWGKMGFADIGKINTLNFTSYDELVELEPDRNYITIGYNCSATVSTEYGLFTIYLVDFDDINDDNDGERRYKIIDIEKINED